MNEGVQCAAAGHHHNLQAVPITPLKGLWSKSLVDMTSPEVGLTCSTGAAYVQSAMHNAYAKQILVSLQNGIPTSARHKQVGTEPAETLLL